MRAERPRSVAQLLHNLGDGNHRRIAGENSRRRPVLLDLGEQLLLQWQILQHGLDDVIGITDRGGEMGRRFHPFDRRLVFPKLPQERLPSGKAKRRQIVRLRA